MNCPDKLQRYTLLSGAFLLTNAAAQATIVYTNVDPNNSFSNDVFDVDFNADGTTDLSIDHRFSAFTSYLKGSAVAYGNPLREYIPSLFRNQMPALDAGASIGAPGQSFAPVFETMGIYIASGTFLISSGQWQPGTNKFIGARFDLVDGPHYGWVRCVVDPSYAGITIHDFAYESDPNTPIAAGATGSACSPSVAPHSLTLSETASTLTFGWTPTPASAACQVQISYRNAVPSDVFSKAVVGFEPSSLVAPKKRLPDWVPIDSTIPPFLDWRVRCTCSLSPLSPSPFSAIASWPLPFVRLDAALATPRLRPNPAGSWTNLYMTNSTTEARTASVLDASGRVLKELVVPAGEDKLHIPLNEMPFGILMIKLEGEATLPFVHAATTP